MTQVKEPMLVEPVFNDVDFNRLKSLFNDPKSFEFQEGFSRWVAADNRIPELNHYAYLITPMARELFGSKTLLPTYTLFSHYEGPDAKLWKHKDDNACTYTVDMCVYQKHSWDLHVEGKPYTLHPNQALAYYGNDQEHWREAFPEPNTNHVAMIFFHFAEPDHWFFTKGSGYLSVIRGQMTDEQWEARK